MIPAGLTNSTLIDNGLFDAVVPFAHAGHWFASMLYLMPVVLLGGGIIWQRRNDRMLDEEGGHTPDEEVPFSD